jgi:hypothetical protein
MTMRNFPSRPIGWLAITTGAVAIFAVVSITFMFAVGGIFGLLNDLANGAEAILSALLAWRLLPWLRSRAPRSSHFSLMAAWLGAVIAVIGSALIIFDVTGWYLAGLYTMFGYALVGVWMFAVSYAALRSGAAMRHLPQLGLLAAICMALGFLAVPGILGGVDDVDAAPVLVNVGLLGSLGWMFLYPAWCLWLGRLLLSNSARMGVATQA